MKLWKFTKLVVLGAAVSRVVLFADTYRLTVTKDGQTVKFCVNNMTSGGSDSFSVKKVDGSYESGDWAVSGCVENITVGTGLEFDFGKFHVNFDSQDRVQLSEGRFEDMLSLENTNCETIVPKTKTLKVNTLVVDGVAVFKNEGILETFVTVLQDCKTAENKGRFHARNLFLLNTDIQNYDVVSRNDAFKAKTGRSSQKRPMTVRPRKKASSKWRRKPEIHSCSPA